MRYKDFAAIFLVIFQTTRQFDIACVRLILGKVGVDGFTGPRYETSVRYEFGFKVILKGLGRK